MDRQVEDRGGSVRGPPGCFGRRTMRHIGDAYGGGNQYCSDSLLFVSFLIWNYWIQLRFGKIGLKS